MLISQKDLVLVQCGHLSSGLIVLGSSLPAQCGISYLSYQQSHRYHYSVLDSGPYGLLVKWPLTVVGHKHTIYKVYMDIFEPSTLGTALSQALRLLEGEPQGTEPA